MNILPKIFITTVCATLAACSPLMRSQAENRATAIFEAGIDLNSSEVFYVERFSSDKRNLNKIIADNISGRGYKATAGEPGQVPDNATLVVSYVDDWKWDMTSYMIELTIIFEESKTGTAIARGNSQHPSRYRKSPEEMIDEVLTSIIEADLAED